MQVVAPEGARKKVEETVHVDTTDPRFGDPNVQFVTVPGTRGREAALTVRGENGITLVLNDIVGNIRHPSGFGGWFLRTMGFAGDEPHVPRPVKLAMIDDKAALRPSCGRSRVAQAHPGLARLAIRTGRAGRCAIWPDRLA
jgi:hypothetical protein